MQFEAGDYESSLNTLNDYLTKNPEDIDALLLKAQILAGTGSAVFKEKEFAQKSIEIADTVLEKNPNNSIALYVKGYANEIQNNFIEALKFYEQALVINPNEIRILNQLGHVNELMGNSIVAKGYYEKSFKINPDSDVILSNIARIYWGEGKIDLTKSLLLKVLEKSSNNHRLAEAAYALSLIEQDSNNLKEALNYAERAVNFDSKYPNALVTSGWIKFRIITELANNKEEKEKISNDGITLEKAFGEIKSAVDIYPNQTIAYLAMARMYSRLSEFKPFIQIALDNYSKAIEVVDIDISLMGEARTKLKNEIILEKKSFEKASSGYVIVPIKATLNTSKVNNEGGFISFIENFIKDSVYIKTVHAGGYWWGDCWIGEGDGGNEADYCNNYTSYSAWITYLNNNGHSINNYDGYGDTSAYCTNGSWIYCENCYPVNGQCNPTAILPHSAQPVAPLCSVGTASTVSSSSSVGPWSWTCSGSNGGTTATCNAPTLIHLSGSCSVSPNPAVLIENSVNVIWSATAANGIGSYTYSWTGTDGLTGTGSSVSKNYTATGTKNANVVITSGDEEITIACTGSAVADEDGDGGGGGGGGVPVVLPTPVPGKCVVGGPYESVPTDPSFLCLTGFPTGFTGNGSIAVPWSWTCNGLYEEHPTSDDCTALKTVSLDTDLDCGLSMIPVASSTVKINTDTTWQVSSDCPTCLKTWSVDGVVKDEGVNNTFNNIFTTVGQKMVSVKIASTSESLAGNPCSATTTVIQVGNLEEI